MNVLLHDIDPFVGLILFALAPVLFVILLRRRRKADVIALAMYLASYVVFSFLGEYTVASYGGMDWRRKWCPRYLVQEYTSPVGRAKTDFTLLGSLYWPCVFLDHLIWHRVTGAEV